MTNYNRREAVGGNAVEADAADYSRYTGLISLRQVQSLFVWRNPTTLKALVAKGRLQVYDAERCLQLTLDAAITTIETTGMETLYAAGTEIAEMIDRRKDSCSLRALYFKRLEQALAQNHPAAKRVSGLEEKL